MMKINACRSHGQAMDGTFVLSNYFRILFCDGLFKKAVTVLASGIR
jgi:hypothetical protein